MSEIKVGDTVLYNGELPRVVEIIKNEDGSTSKGRVAKVEMKNPMEVTIVALNGGVGKDIGIKLGTAPAGYAWYDAHECDKACEKGFGWWSTRDHIEALNPDPVPQDPQPQV